MNTTPLTEWKLRIDDWRVRQHFKRVETILRDRDVSHLPPHLQRSREHYLDVLHDYAARGVFPRNHERAGIAPCFIDLDRRECAVAHLIIRSGQSELAHKLAIEANYATIPQMTFPELDSWGAEVGLSREELTLIQPGYWYSLGDLLPIVLTAWGAGLLTILMNAKRIVPKRLRVVSFLLSGIVIVSLIYIGLTCLNEAIIAYGLGTQPYDGHNGRFPGTPLRDVGPLLLGCVVSAALALLTAIYTLRNSDQSTGDKS